MEGFKLFRPLMLLGFFLIALGVFSWLMVPSWRQSPIGALVLLASFGLGAYAVISDMRSLWRELRKQQEEKERASQQDEDNQE
jgi:hypothetical protein